MEGGIQVDGSAVQSRRHGQHLEGGAGLIAVGEHPVAPLLQPGGGQRLLIVLRPPQALNLRRDLGVCQLQIPVGVVASQGGHGENLPGFAVHHQAKGTVLYIVAGNRRLHLLFQALLYRSVQGQDYGISLPGGKIVFVGIGHIHFVVALGGDHPAGFPGQKAVVGRLHPLAAVVGGVGEADDLGGQAFVGVHPLRGRFQVDARNVLPVDVIPDFPGGGFVDSGSHLLVALAGVGGLLGNPGRVFAQNLAQNP